MATAEIRVSAQFPQSPNHRDLSPQNWRWIHFLTFPVDKINHPNFRISHYPYKWIRFAAGSILGVNGHLSTDRDSLQLVSYGDQDLPSQSIDLFFTVANTDKPRIYLVDRLLRKESVSSVEGSRRRAHFRRDVIERDRFCVLTGREPDYCDAVHMLPHMRGDEYIKKVTSRRSTLHEPYVRNDTVSEIDDIHNGLCLHNSTHRALHRKVAFLKTPNFAMDTTDIDPGVPGGNTIQYTAHLFDPEDSGALGDSSIHNGHPLRVAAAVSDWPPDVLFDFSYAATVIYNFGVLPADAEFSDMWDQNYYPFGAMTAAQLYAHRTAEDDAAKFQKITMQSTERGGREQARDARNVPDLTHTPDASNTSDIVSDTSDVADSADDIQFDVRDPFDRLMLPCFMMSPRLAREYLEEQRDKDNVVRRKELEEKVNEWRGVIGAESA